MEKRIVTDFAKEARSHLIREGNFMAACVLDFLVCGAINEPLLLADGTIFDKFFCVRCDQRALATRKLELWECPGNSLINHTHMAQEFWDADQVLFARGLLPRDWLLVNELTECTEARMRESSCFNECANNNLLEALTDREAAVTLPESLRQVACGVATCKFSVTHL